MCGIAGFVGGFVPGLMARMNAAQTHRGPDGSGMFENCDRQIALGHVRLAILDLSDQGRQPMHSETGRYVLVFNGEIYNFVELRERLISLGHTFQSSGDTQVILHGLEEEGEAFLDRVNGMFAFALWDRQEQELLLARDHLGVKPLYYAEPEPGTFLFASEIKALCAHPAVTRAPDFEVLQQHLAYCHASDHRTALRGISRLEPGSLIRWKAATRAYSIRRYWQTSYEHASQPDRQQATIELRTRLQGATVRQLVSDVSVGSFLSGGLDSSLITAFARSEIGADFQCYTITYAQTENIVDGADDDTPHARAVAKALGLRLQEIEIKPEVAALWPQLVYHLDEPIADPAAISCYLISRLARQNGTKVLLSGQGADELFCGYPRYWAMNVTRGTNRIPRAARQVMSAGARLLPGSREGRLGAGLRRLRRVGSALDESLDERFLSYCASTPEAEITRVLSYDFRAALGERRYKDSCLRHLSERSLSGLERFQDRDISSYLPNHNLLYTDKMGMAVGLEARVPFLDREVVDVVTRYPPDWKISGRTTKALLRDAARGIVPDHVIDRPKAGFGAPYRKWLRYDLAELWGDVMSESAIKRRGWFDYTALQRARQRSHTGREDLYMLQWATLTIELWAQQFIDKNPATI